MKNPGCFNNRGFSSVRLRELILPNPGVPKRAYGDDTHSQNRLRR